MPEIDWIIPISLGDSHKQFRVMGTTQNYFENFLIEKIKNYSLNLEHILKILLML